MEYLDYNATAPLLDECREAVSSWMRDVSVGNPSSLHGSGRGQRALIEEARVRVARSIGTGSTSIVFTSGASESLFLALDKTLDPLFIAGKKPCVLTHVGLHESLAKRLSEWFDQGRIELETVELQGSGMWMEDDWRSASHRAPDMICLSLAQHETGVLFPVKRVRDIFPDTPLLLDGVQAYGKISLSCADLKSDWLVLSGHKVGGLPGVGVLVIGERARGRVRERLGQESGWRPGTENGPGIVSFGEAARHIETRIASYEAVTGVRLKLESVLQSLPGVRVVSADTPRLPNTCLALFEDLDAEDLQEALYRLGYCVGTGAACASGTKEASPTLLSMGYTSEEIGGSIRFSLGPDHDDGLVASLSQTLVEWLPRLRAGSFPSRP